MALTPRQEEILAFISDFQRENKVPPSTRVIQKQFGFGSQTTVMRHLGALANKGSLEQLGDGTWGAKVNEVQTVFSLSIFGEIPAGLPTSEEQKPDEKISVDPALFGISDSRKEKLWGLRIKGDSMMNAQIRDGDIGVFEYREPRVGEIIAALVDETTVTLKRLVQVRGRRILRAENKKYPDIVPAVKLECQGVLVGLIRGKIA